MPGPTTPSTLAERRGLMLLLFAALILRLWHLGALSLWTDEAYMWAAVRGSLGEVWRFCMYKDASPPLFHLLTWLALRLGDDEANLRLVSALASVVMVWLTYRLARLWADRREALVAAALVALSPFQLMYAQEARNYMLVGVWTVLALYLFARALLLGRPRAWWPLSGAIALGLWTQPIAVLGLGAQGLLALIRAPGWRRLGRWALAVAVGIALYLPWLIVGLQQAAHTGDSHWYIDRPDSRDAFQVLRALMLSPVPLVTAPASAPAPGLEALMPRALAQLLLLVLAFVPLAIGASAGIRRDARGEGARFALVALLAPLLAVFALSFKQSFWLPRYFVFLTPFVALLTASGLMRMRPGALARGWGVVLLVVSAYACVRVEWDYGKERWREVTRSIVARAVAGRSAVLVPYNSAPVLYYERTLTAPPPAFEVSHPDVPFQSEWTPAQMEEMSRTARAQVVGREDVWVIVCSPSSEPRRRVAALAESAAAGEGRALVLRETWDSTTGPLHVSRYRRGAPPIDARLEAGK